MFHPYYFYSFIKYVDMARKFTLHNHNVNSDIYRRGVVEKGSTKNKHWIAVKEYL